MVFTVLVAYNPDVSELRYLIELLQKQTSRIVICSNSDWALEFCHHKIKVFNFGQNLGIAAAQSIGMKWSFESGADFVLQMDQDSIPTPKMVSELLNSYTELSTKGFNIGLVGVQDFDNRTSRLNRARLNKGRKIPGTNFKLVSETLSSGSLIPRQAYEVVGGMEDGLFIDAVDFEYCWRLKKHGFVVVRNQNALLGHCLGEGTKRIFGFVNVRVPSPVRHYYAFRNSINLVKRRYVPLYWKMSSMVKVVMKLIFYPLALHPGKERLYYMLRGIKDGILGRYGSIDEK